MASDRSEFEMGTLADGRLVAAGGGWPNGSSTEIFDPATLSWAVTGSTSVGHRSAAIAPTAAGGMLVAGGTNTDGTIAETYDPATGVWTPTGSMTEKRTGHTMHLLSTGKVISRSQEPRNPAFKIVVREGKAYRDTTWAMLSLPPHFARNSYLAFKVMRIDFIGREPLVADSVQAYKELEALKEAARKMRPREIGLATGGRKARRASAR